MPTVFLYEAITNQTLNNIREQIPANNQPFDLRINSLGGSVFAGVGVFDFLQSLPNEINVIIDGFVGSISTLIMLSGDSITASEGSFVMIHNASSQAGGNKMALSEQVELLNKVDNILVDAFVEKTTLERSTIEDMMNKETIMDANEALGFGFIDSIGESLQISATFNLNKKEMENILEKLKLQAKAILGQKETSEEAQAVIDKLADEAKAKAEAEVEAKMKGADKVGDAVLADKVSNKEYLAYTSQVNEFITNALQVFTQFEARLTKSEEEQDAKITAKMDELLAEVKSTAKVPASSNQFTEKIEGKKVDFSEIEKLKTSIKSKIKA